MLGRALSIGGVGRKGRVLTQWVSFKVYKELQEDQTWISLVFCPHCLVSSMVHNSCSTNAEVHLSAQWISESILDSLGCICLSFVICKMGITAGPYLEVLS